MTATEAPSTDSPGGRRVYSVSDLSGEVRRLLEDSYSGVWIEGEISNLSTPASGHSYFSLKDDRAQIRCALFRSRRLRCACQPRNGAQVLLRGRVSLYEPRGDFQLIVDYLEDAGEGALRRAVEQTRLKLTAEGLFDDARKQPLPELPSAVGVVTSATGAALRDILVTLRRLAPWLPVVLYPVVVQGDAAPAAIVAALDEASRRADCRVLLVARGGGSLEDLMAFNDESVARAIARCPIPLISGVGHETDVSIADFVADHRAATPTAAAQAACGQWPQMADRTGRLRTELSRLAERRLQSAQQRLDGTARRLRHPRDRLHQQRFMLGTLEARLSSTITARMAADSGKLALLGQRLAGHRPASPLASSRERLERYRVELARSLRHQLASRAGMLDSLGRQLRQLDPHNTLARGYAILSDRSQRVVTRADAVEPGEAVTATLADGVLDLEIKGRRST